MRARAWNRGEAAAVLAVALMVGAATGGCGVDQENLGPVNVPPQAPPATTGAGGEGGGAGGAAGSAGGGEPDLRRTPGAPPATVPEPHKVVLSGTNIDKDMYVWLERAPVNELVFYASERSGSVNLTEALERRGVSAAVIQLKLGNGDCFAASGDLAISVDGQPRWTASVDKRLTDCGWQLEARVRVDLAGGAVDELSRWMK